MIELLDKTNKYSLKHILEMYESNKCTTTKKCKNKPRIFVRTNEYGSVFYKISCSKHNSPETPFKKLSLKDIFYIKISLDIP